MRCPYCSSEISDQALFCPACGSRLEGAPPASPVPDAAPVSEGSAARGGSPVARKVLIVSIVVLVLVAAGVGGFLLWRGAQESALSSEQALELVEGDLAQEQFADTGREWGSGEPLEYASSEVTDIAPSPSDAAVTIVHVSSVYENSSISMTVSWEAAFSRSGDAWEGRGYTQVDQHVEPTGPISDEVLVAHVPTLMQLVDENPHTDADGDTVRLSDLYVSGTQFEVVENNTGSDGGTASISIFAMSGIQSYSGTLTASFAWDDAAGDWSLTGCSVDDGAYAPSYDGLIGTWNGTLVSTDSSMMACYGGREHPATITVKSVDSVAGTATMDISCVVHNHPAIDGSDAASSPGDEYVTASDVLVTLQEAGRFKIYESATPAEYTVYLNVRDGGGLTLRVETEQHGFVSTSAGTVCARQDEYELAKSPTETAGAEDSAATQDPATEGSAREDPFVRNAREQLGVPDGPGITYEIGEPYFWEGAGITVTPITFYEGGSYVASADCTEDGSPATSIMAYTAP